MKIAGLTEGNFVHTLIRKRPKDMHKGDAGRVLIVAGSRSMAGAAVFAGKAAIKSGSGLVRVCTEKKIFPVLQMAVPELICTSWTKIKGDLQQFDVIAAGPGMGVGRRTEHILRQMLREYHQTMVIDADGLNVIAGSAQLQQLLRESDAPIIMTPHMGEAKRLLGSDWPESGSKEDVAAALTARYRCIVVVKGQGTLVAVSGEEAYINTTGNPGMATAGSGDVLTGVIASLAGQGLAAEDAARAGVFVHGRSGDLAAEKLGEYGLTASDIADCLPFALKELTE